MGKGKTSLGGAATTMIPVPGEKSKTKSGGKIEGTPTSGVVKGNPLAATYDSRPKAGDNQMGATRAKGNDGKGAGQVKKLGGH